MLAVVLKEYVVREHITQSVAVGWTSPTTHPRTVTFVTTEGTCIDQHSIAAEITLKIVLATQVNMQCLTEEVLVMVIDPNG